MSKSLIYTVNNTTQKVADGGMISLGATVRRYGPNIRAINGEIALVGDGFYSGIANITLTAETAGTGVIAVNMDGMNVAGASATLTTEQGSSYAVAVPFVVRRYCCNTSMISVTLSGISASVTNATITARKE